MAGPNPPSKTSKVVWGVLTIAIGLIVILVSADVILVDESSFNAPRWVVGVASLIFVLLGVMVVLVPPRRVGASQGEKTTAKPALRMVTHFWLPAVVITLFAVVANWVAFGPGERQFSGEIDIPLGLFSVETSETTGR